MRTILNVIFWTLALAFLATTIALLGGGDFAAVIGVLSPLPALVVSLLTVQSRLAFRKRRAAIVLSYLEQAVRLNLPLPRFLTAAAASEDTVTGRRIIALRDRLELGWSISEAMEKAVPEMPRLAIALVAAAERTGHLPQTLDRLVRYNRRPPRDVTDQAFFLTYPVAMTGTIVFIVGMIMVFVIPKYEQIMKDFHMQLPPPTLLLLDVSRVAVVYFPVIVVVLILLLLAWLAVGWIWPARERRWSWLTGWFTRNRDLADVCRVVADALGAALPLDAALRQAAELPIGGSMRWRMFRWASGIERGMPAADAARRARMPALIAGLTATGEITQARETFVFLARYYGTRFRRLQELARGAAVPAMVFFFATIVATVALGLFMPIITLITAASPYKNSL